MSKIMLYIKNILKKSPYMVKLYELLIVKARIPRVKLTVKTHYSFGKENADKKFYLIKCSNEYNGLFSSVFYILPFINYALKRHYIPVVDFQNSFLPMLQDFDKKGNENAWEYYYEQPIRDYSLEDVFQSKHVIQITENEDRLIPYVNWDKMFPTSDKQLNYWHNLIKKYVRLNENLGKKIDSCQKILFPTGVKIMGVSIRAGFRAGMLMKLELYKGHPKVTSCEQYIKFVEAKMKEWKCDYIFLAIDDREYLEKFKKYFGDKCLYVERNLLHYFENDIPVANAEKRIQEFKNLTIYRRNEEYIIETYLLAKCTSLYSCIGGQGKFAYFVNGGKYENLEVYNEGIIGCDDK